jgi:hypothetical protein
MLSRLLELRAGGTRRVSDLARELETTPALVEAMLEHLAHKGYLERVGEECSEKCAACPLGGLCAVGAPSTLPGTGSGRVWTLANKGSTSTSIAAADGKRISG